MDTGFQDYYALLAVSRYADDMKLTSAWIVAAVMYDPSHALQQQGYGELLPMAEARFRLIGSTYNTLIDPTTRSTYDAQHTHRSLGTVEAIMAERAKSMIVDTSEDPVFALRTPAMWERFWTERWRSATAVAEWFMTALESGGEGETPALLEDDSIIAALAANRHLTDGDAREILDSVVQLHAAEKVLESVADAEAAELAATEIVTAMLRLLSPLPLENIPEHPEYEGPTTANATLVHMPLSPLDSFVSTRIARNPTFVYQHPSPAYLPRIRRVRPLSVIISEPEEASLKNQSFGGSPPVSGSSTDQYNQERERPSHPSPITPDTPSTQPQPRPSTSPYRRHSMPAQLPQRNCTSPTLGEPLSPLTTRVRSFFKPRASEPTLNVPRDERRRPWSTVSKISSSSSAETCTPPPFIANFATAWAASTPHALPVHFTVIKDADLPPGARCCEWGIYFYGQVVWEVWKGSNSSSSGTAEPRPVRYLVRRELDGEHEAQLLQAIACASDGEEAGEEAAGWKPRERVFNKREADGTLREYPATEHRRGEWSFCVLPEYLYDGWDADEIDETDDEGEVAPQRARRPAAGTGDAAGSNDGPRWWRKILPWHKKDLAAPGPAGMLPAPQPELRQSTSQTITPPVESPTVSSTFCHKRASRPTSLRRSISDIVLPDSPTVGRDASRTPPPSPAHTRTSSMVALAPTPNTALSVSGQATPVTTSTSTGSSPRHSLRRVPVPKAEEIGLRLLASGAGDLADPPPPPRPRRSAKRHSLPDSISASASTSTSVLGLDLSSGAQEVLVNIEVELPPPPIKTPPVLTPTSAHTFGTRTTYHRLNFPHVIVTPSTPTTAGAPGTPGTPSTPGTMDRHTESIPRHPEGRVSPKVEATPESPRTPRSPRSPKRKEHLNPKKKRFLSFKAALAPRPRLSFGSSSRSRSGSGSGSGSGSASASASLGRWTRRSGDGLGLWRTHPPVPDLAAGQSQSHPSTPELVLATPPQCNDHLVDLTVLSIIQAEVEVEVEVGAEARKDPLHLRM